MRNFTNGMYRPHMMRPAPRLPSRFPAIVAASLAIAVAGLAVPACAQGVKIQRLGGGRYMTEMVRQISARGLSQLSLTGPSNLGGNITVIARPTDSVRMEMVKIFKAPSEEMAAAWEQEITFDLSPSGSILQVEVRTRRGAPWEGTNWSARVELTVTVPFNWDLDIKARFFEFDLAGPFSSASVHTEFGRVKLEKVAKRTDVTGSYTGIELADVRGEITARTSYADLEVSGAIPAADKAARLENSFGPITVREFAGAIDAETRNAPISLSEVVLVGSGSSLRGANAPIEAEILEFGDAQLEIRNGNAPVTLKVPRSVSARLNLSVGGGGLIHTDGLTIQTRVDLLRTGHLEGVCGSGQGLIDIDVTGFGQIELAGK